MVIRSSRVHEEPRVLVRAPRTELPRAEQEQQSATALHHVGKPASVIENRMEESLAYGHENWPAVSTPEDAAAKTEDATTNMISYEEYQSRFHEELEALRTQTREAAYQEGHAEGLAAGRNTGQTEFSQRTEELHAVLNSARESVEQRLDGLVDTAVEIVFESVSKILGTQFADKTGTEAVVREVIRQSKERSKLVVRLSPSDFEMLTQGRMELADGLNIGQVDFVADDLVELGGCVLETPSGSLDGRLEIQLQRFRETLLNARLKWHEHGD